MGKKKFEDGDDFQVWLDQVTANRFDRRHCFENGNLAALLDALMDSLNGDVRGCRSENKEPKPDDLVKIPRWVADALSKELTSNLLKKKRWMGGYAQALIDWHRYKLVWLLLLGPNGGREFGPLSAKERRRKRVEYQRGQTDRGTAFTVHPGLPHPWTADPRTPDDLNAFDAAAKILEASPTYKGKGPTIRTSWEKVGKAIRKGESWRYYPAKWVRFRGHKLDADSVLPKNHSDEQG